jgi:osmotically-inducible protein OsmY
MVASRMEMKIGSPVIAADGPYGHLQQVIVDPHQERIVALLVRQSGPLIPQIVVVPEQDVADANDSEVRLKIGQEQLKILPEYKAGTGLVVEGRKYEAGDELFAVRESQGFQVGRTPSSRRPGMLESQLDPSERERQALQLRAGRQVFCRDGHAGKASLVLTTHGGWLKGFVLQAGHLPGRSLIVPVAWVEEVDRENVYLSVEKSALESLPDYRADDALAAEVIHALWTDDTLRLRDYFEIGVKVEDGIVTLRGHVTTSLNRTHAEDAARLVQGVLGVENRLVVDWDLVMVVAQALGRDERMHQERVLVGAQNGVITLNGHVGSAAIRQAAAEAAASLPKVRGVINYLHAPNVVIDPKDEQVVEPPMGGMVYAKDMLLGNVVRVIIDPHNRRVTAFVVHGHFPDLRTADERTSSELIPLPERFTRVPIRSVRYETDNSVDLDVDGDEVTRYHEFDPADFITPPQDWEPPYPYQWGEVLFEKKSEDEPKS